jgi:DNA-binding NtrC family response regulator
MQDSNTFVTSAEIPVLEKKVLIVEDEMVFAKAVEKRLQRAGYKIELAGDLKTANSKFKTSSPDLILLDMRLPDGSGLDFLSDLRSKHQSSVAVLVMSAYGELEDAVAAMKLGATDYLKKPMDLEELLLNVEKVFDKDELTRKLTYSAKRELHAVEEVDFLGECPAIRSIREQVKRIAQLSQSVDTIPPTVLILGVTGTGKDVIARLLHANSARNHKPFVHVDCASLPKDLIESELFGHEKGAFTNAHVARTGLIEAAEDGALFLDEIGELPMNLHTIQITGRTGAQDDTASRDYTGTSRRCLDHRCNE